MHAGCGLAHPQRSEHGGLHAIGKGLAGAVGEGQLRHAKGAVVMSLDTYNSLMETVHLLRYPANAAHLLRSLEQAGRW